MMFYLVCVQERVRKTILMVGKEMEQAFYGNKDMPLCVVIPKSFKVMTEVDCDLFVQTG